MFTLDTVLGGLTRPFVIVQHKQRELTLEISTIVQIRRKITAADQESEREVYDCFYLLNRYLEWKGDSFKDILFEKIELACKMFLETALNEDIYPMPIQEVHTILDLFDIEELLDFVKRVEAISVPSILKEEFDPETERNQLGTREQTYLKSDYLKLAAMSVPIKAVFGVIGHYGMLKKEVMKKWTHRKLIMHQFISSHRISESEPMKKIMRMIDKIILQKHMKDEEIANIIIGNGMISKEIMPNFFLSTIVLEIVPLTSFRHCTDANNVATRIYNTINSKLTFNKKQTSNSVLDKKPDTMVSDGSGDGEESFYEAFTQLSEQTQADIHELQWACSSIKTIYDSFIPKSLKSKISYQDMVDSVRWLKRIKDEAILLVPPQIILLTFTSKLILDPRNIRYLNLDNVLNLMAFGYAYCRSIENDIIAILLTSIYENKKTSTGVKIGQYSSISNVAKLSSALKEKLDIYFNNFKIIDDSKRGNENSIETVINYSIINAFSSYTIKPTVPLELFGLDKLNQKQLKEVLLPEDIRNIVAEFIIQNEEIYETIVEEPIRWIDGKDYHI